MTTWVWEFLYLIQMLFLSIAFGVWTSRRIQWIPTPKLVRFLIGFCSTPYLIGLWVLLVATITTSGSRYLYTIPLLIISGLILWFEGPASYRENKSVIQQKIHSLKDNVPFIRILIWLGFTIVFAYLSTFLYHNSRQVVGGYDALGYLSKATYLIGHSPSSLITEGDGAFRGDDHGLTFPAYLSHALVMTGGEIGYPNDQAARDAFQLTFIYMMLAIVALGASLGSPETGLLAGVILLLVPQFDYVSFANSRDAYRIIPLLLLAAVLFHYRPPQFTHKVNHRLFNVPLILSMFAFEGHSLGGLIVVFIALAWLLWVVVSYRSFSLNHVFILMALAIGLFLGGIRYAVQFTYTGSFFTPASTEWRAGTPLDDSPLQKISNAETDRYESQNGIQLLSRDRYLVALPAILFAFAYLLVAVFQKDNRDSANGFISLIVVVNLIPFLGVFDNPLISISRFLRNERYTLHFYPFAAILLVCLLRSLFQWFTNQFYSKYKRDISLVFPGLILVSILGSFFTMYSRWSAPFDSEYWINEVIDPLIKADQIISEDRHILLEDMRYNYFLDNEAIAMFTRATWPIFRSETVKDTGEILDDLKVGAVALSSDRIYGWWDQIALYDYLSKSEKAVLAFSSSKYQLYYLVWDDTDRERIVDACLRGEGCNVLEDELIHVAARIQPTELSAGSELILNEQWNEAASLYEQYLETGHPGSSFYLVLADIYKNQGRIEEMLSAYKSAYQLSSSPTDITEFIAHQIPIETEYVLPYLYEGMAYQSPKSPATHYDFLDHLNSGKIISPSPSGYVKQTVFTFDMIPYGVLFEHAPSNISFAVTIPENSSLHFAPLVAPEIQQFGKGDGIRFQITFTTQDGDLYAVYDEYLDPKNLLNQRYVLEESIDLSYWAGENITITFSTNCGPNENCSFDWAGWGEPRIIQPVSYDFLEHFAETNSDNLGTSTGQSEVITQTINYDTRSILFQHPSSRVTYSIDLPEKAVLQFGLGVSPEAWSAENSDGVEYNLYIRSEQRPDALYRVYQNIIDPKNNPEDRRWFDERVDLRQFGGQHVEIVFEALPGTANNFDYDWGGWSQPVLIDETPPPSRKTQVHGNTP